MPRRTATTRLADPDLLGEIDRVRETLKMAKLAEQISPKGLDTDVPRLESELLDLSRKAADTAQSFLVQALPGEEFDELKRRHQPSPEQLAAYKAQAAVFPWAEMPEFDPDSMGVELFVACLIDPDWPDEQIRSYWADLSKGQQTQLWNAALSVNVGGSNIPFYGAATGTTDGGGGSSTTSANEESPSPNT